MLRFAMIRSCFYLYFPPVFPGNGSVAGVSLVKLGGQYREIEHLGCGRKYEQEIRGEL